MSEANAKVMEVQAGQYVNKAEPVLDLDELVLDIREEHLETIAQRVVQIFKAEGLVVVRQAELVAKPEANVNSIAEEAKQAKLKEIDAARKVLADLESEAVKFETPLAPLAQSKAVVATVAPVATPKVYKADKLWVKGIKGAAKVENKFWGLLGGVWNTAKVPFAHPKTSLTLLTLGTFSGGLASYFIR